MTNRETAANDTLLLQTILAEDVGIIANIVQAAVELSDAHPEWDLHNRLQAAYYELTNHDPAAETDIIGLADRDPLHTEDFYNGDEFPDDPEALQ